MTTPTLTERKRADILKAALNEFNARGFRETSMDRIASSAQVSKRTVYNHFASKEALFDAIADKLSDRVRLVTGFQYRPDRSVETQLRDIGEQLLDMLAAPGFVNLAKVTLAEMLRSPELARKTYDLFRERQSGLAAWLGEAAADGRLDIEVVAELLGRPEARTVVVRQDHEAGDFGRRRELGQQRDVEAGPGGQAGQTVRSQAGLDTLSDGQHRAAQGH